jgi:membrane protease YdiL (CAAX protease family)
MAAEAVQTSPLLGARGSLPRDRDITHPANARRIRLLIELGLFFLVAPMLIREAIFTWRIPLPVVLQPLLLGFIAYMLWDPTFKLRRELSHRYPLPTLVAILGTFAVIASAVALWVAIELPHRFLALPRGNWPVWLAIMILYPLLSVIPQELIYRTFFFHRYGPLFGSSRWLAILTNGLLFGFAHIIFGSVVSIVLTAFLGCLLAWRYDETRALWAVWLEHSLYGCLIFTVGLGHYFFTGIASMR